MESLSKFKSIYLWLFIVGIVSLIIPAANIFFITTAILILGTVYIIAKSPKDAVKKRGAIVLLVGAIFTILAFVLFQAVHIDSELLKQLQQNSQAIDEQKLSQYIMAMLPGFIVAFIGWVIRIVGVVLSFKEYRYLKKEEA
ncbi:hypothetical protein R4Y45_01785 [Holzapfeliella sp. He02]|uniref:Uncharacterized protein n=1 Tax=Holzapfeliella saturejae TaxID=3082953 RepID=A0ABU8SGA4_9LACO